MKFKKSKCFFGHTEIPFLGFLVNSEGIKPQPEKVRLIRLFPRPKTVRQTKSFIGLATYYKSFIPDFSVLMCPVYELTKPRTKFVWTEAHSVVFQ